MKGLGLVGPVLVCAVAIVAVARAEARVQVAFENRLEVRVQNIRKVLEGKLKEKKAALPGS